MDLFIVNTCKVRDTKTLVENVGKLKQESPEDFTELLSTIGDCASSLIEICEEEPMDKMAFWDYVSMCQ